MKKDPADKPSKKTPAKTNSKSPKKQTGDKPTNTQVGKLSAKAPNEKQGMMTTAEAESRYGTWAVLAGEQSEEEARAMVDELWMLLNDPEEYKKQNPIKNIMGLHEGRRPEKVHLIFKGEAVKKVLSREWHPTQNWRHHPDGTLDYWLEISPCWQLKRWVLGFGGDFKVVSPTGFRAIIHDYGRMLAEKYSKSPDV